MYIGIDAGGTKTDICICDKGGHIIARSISGGMNAARAGAKTAAEYFAARLHEMGVTRAESLYIGEAGAGNPAISAAITEYLRGILPDIGRICVHSDAFNALNAEVGMGDGIALIAGTGSSAFVRINGAARQIGGRGSLIDDAGSGYWTGRQCLDAAFRALDGRGPATALVSAAENMLGMPLADAIPKIYEGGTAYIASFAPLVFEHAEKGDAIAADIADRCASELALHISACTAGLTEPYPVCVASGGMFRSAFLRSALANIFSLTSQKIICSSLPPVCGAVIAAAGEAADLHFAYTLRQESGDQNNGL